MEGVNEINILLLGETGVGKSTFINSFANYIKHESFDDATKEKPIMIIPTIITVYDDKTKEDRSLTIGSDKNEQQEVGKSATQSVQIYYFPIEGQNLMVKLIDTPGIGDTRGPDKDDENCQGILDYLSSLDKLHVICFLLKPSNDRCTVLFNYCVRRLLSQLHKSACDNIAFVFTNTKGSDYRPGATLPILKQIRDDIAKDPPYAKILISEDNVFCLENECFKHLLALDYGIKIEKRTLMSCRNSWEISRDEIIRFVKYANTIKPHNVKETVSVNQIRDLILQLSKPMYDICEILQNKIIDLDTKIAESKNKDQNLNELKRKLYKPGLDLEIIKLNSAVTVCTSLSCVEPIKVGNNIIKHRYKTKCHDPCLLGYINYEVIGHWSLTTCSEMDWWLRCKHCECSFRNHMSIFYDTKIVEKQFVDEEIQKDIESEEVQREKLNGIIEQIHKEKKELELEFEFITACAAKFAFYLQNHALTSSYDQFKEYIYLSLQRQRSLGNKANMEIINNLNNMLQRHEKLIEVLKQKNTKVSSEQINESTIQADQKKLFELKINGIKMREIFDARNECVKKSKSSFIKRMLHAVPAWFLK